MSRPQPSVLQLGPGGHLQQTTRRMVLAALLVGLLVLAVYLPTVGYDFTNFDDRDYVTHNSRLYWPLARYLAAITTSFVPPNHGDFLPVTMWSYWVEFQLVGRNAWLFHLDNAWLHAANAFLVCLLVWRLSGRAAVSCLVALLFGLHPMNTEAVSWIAERKSVLSMCLMLLSLHALLTADRTGQRRYWPMCYVLYALACLSKTAVVFLPLIVVAYGAWLARWRVGRVFWRTAPLVVLAVLTAIGRLVGHQRAGQMEEEVFPSLAAQAATILEIFGWYLRKLAVPVQLSAGYPLRVSTTVSSPDVLVGLALALVVVGLLVYAVRHRRWLFALSLSWYVAAWLPHAQIVYIPPALRADRYVYYSCVGAFLAAMLLAEVLYETVRARLAGKAGSVGLPLVSGSLAVALVAACAMGTVARNRAWRDSVALWRDALAKSPSSVTARNKLGAAYLERGQADLAIRPLREAIDLKADHGPAWANLGRALLTTGRTDEAEQAYQRALACEPGNARYITGLAEVYRSQKQWARAVELTTEAVRLDPGWGYAWYVRGTILLDQQDDAGAVDALRKAIALDAGQARPYAELGMLLLKRGEIDRAIAHLDRAASLERANPELLCNLGSAHQSAGHLAQAIEAYERAIQADPNHWGGYNNLAWLLATSQQSAFCRPDRAVSLAEKALALTNLREVDDARRAGVLDTLATAYAATGDFRRAIETQQRALQLTPASARGPLEERLHLYRAGNAYAE
ncbi:MAG TPA: tetratricopeptide repeat protein [Phycisphaerae bacterium]|nr:tetratricopeptide repeat protein [Phycisphaerae bacterium]